MFKQVLHAIRVLDLAPGWSAYTGRLLGDLGAEVIKIELPSGDRLRGTPDFERLNANKYGCALDISSADGRAKLEQLAALADIIIATPGAINLEALMAVKASLIVVALPAEATVEQTIAAAAGVGLALWDRRRTGEGSRIDVTSANGQPRVIPSSNPHTEFVSTLAGDADIPGSSWRLSESATHIRLPAPAVGEHKEYVFGSLLGG